VSHWNVPVVVWFQSTADAEEIASSELPARRRKERSAEFGFMVDARERVGMKVC
jgi:hypothetical protein